jgi:uncharacterized glyoxalase superfamily protein PhnB
MEAHQIPEGYRRVTPYLINEGAAKVIAFLSKAFGAQEKSPPVRRPDGTIMHAEMRIGDSIIMLSEASNQYRPMPACIYLYVDDVDATYRRTLQAGANPVSEPKDQSYGDRSAGVKDQAGNLWWIVTPMQFLPKG